MRPITLWDSRAILAYFPKPAAEKLRYMIIRANELQTAGVADGNNGFFQAVDEIHVAISTELTVAGFTPSGVNDVAAIEALELQLAAKEDELIAQDDTIADLQAQIAALGA